MRNNPAEAEVDVIDDVPHANGRRPVKKHRWAAIVFTFVVAAAYVIVVNRNWQTYAQLARFAAFPIAAIVFATALPDRALVNRWLFRAVGANMSLAESYGFTVTGTLAGQLPLAGGIAAKGFYLKKRFNLPYATYLSATASVFVIAASAAGLTGVVGLLLHSLASGDKLIWPLLAGFAAMAATPLLLFWSPTIIAERPRIYELIRRVTTGMRILSVESGLLIKLVLLSTGGVIFFAFRLWAAFKLFSTEVPFEYCLVFSAATTMTQLVGFAPGGLGIREGIVAALGTMADVDPAISIVAVGIERLLSVGFSGLLAIPMSYLLVRNLVDGEQVLGGAPAHNRE